MQHASERKFPPVEPSRLPNLLEVFGCADVIAAVDVDAFGRKAGELIFQITAGKRTRKKAENVTPTAGKYRLRALQCEEVAAQTPDPSAKHMLTVVAREFMQACQQAER
jgi:hypothetical protein